MVQFIADLGQFLSIKLLPKETSDNISFFPSELPARPPIDDSQSPVKISRPERILREIVSESIPLMAQIMQELPHETVESTKEYLRNLIERKDDHLVVLQNRLNRRCDLTNETLTKCHKTQLEFFVAIKWVLEAFILQKLYQQVNWWKFSYLKGVET